MKYTRGATGCNAHHSCQTSHTTFTHQSCQESQITDAQMSHQTPCVCKRIMHVSCCLTAWGTCLQGRTPLHHAAAANDQPCVKWLLSHGANINATDLNVSHYDFATTNCKRTLKRLFCFMHSWSCPLLGWHVVTSYAVTCYRCDLLCHIVT